MEPNPVPVAIPQESVNGSTVNSFSHIPIPPKPNNRLKILLAIFAVLFVSVVGSFVYLEKRDREKRQVLIAEEPGIIKASPYISADYAAPSYYPNTTTSPNSIAYTYALTLENPPLFPELTWGEVSPEESRFKDYDFIYFRIPNTEIYGEIPASKFTGKEWYAEAISPPEDPSVKLSYRLEKYYFTEFTDRGWNNRVELPNLVLSGAAGGYPLGDTMGYIGVKEDKVRYVIWETYREQTEQCPCKSHQWIFVSDIVTLDELLKLAAAQKN